MALLRRALINGGRILHSSTSINRASVIPLSSTAAKSGFGSQCGWLSRFSTEKSFDSSSLDIDLSTEEGKRRVYNRLLYRSKQRGFLELDLVLGKWVEEHIFSMGENEIKSLIHVLDLENPELWKWLTEQEQPPDAVSANPVFCAVRDRIRNNLNNHAAAETRALPGQPWVRGWDDIKKTAGSPVAGNQ